MRINLDKVFNEFLDECNNMNFEGSREEEDLQFDWEMLNAYLEQPNLRMGKIRDDVETRTGIRRDEYYIEKWLKKNGLYLIEERIQWVESLRMMADDLIELIVAKDKADTINVLQNFYKFCHRRYRTRASSGKEWRVGADKKAFFIQLLKKLEGMTPAIVPTTSLKQAQEYLYPCQRGEADTLLHTFCRLLMVEFDFSPAKIIEETDFSFKEYATREITAFDEEEVNGTNLKEEIEDLQRQITDLWIEREQLPIKFDEYREDEERKFLSNFYEKLADFQKSDKGGLLSRLLAKMPLVEELTQSGFRGQVHYEDYVITVLRLFFRFLREHHLRLDDVSPPPGKEFSRSSDDLGGYNVEGELPDEAKETKVRLIHQGAIVFGKQLLNPRIEIVPE